MMDAGISWDENENEEELLLGRMTVSELKERLRSIGQKVSGVGTVCFAWQREPIFVSLSNHNVSLYTSFPFPYVMLTGYW
jgi:hypothetical protein